MKGQSRWQEIKKTSPSGKTMFVCMCCGRTSPIPESECFHKVSIYFEGTNHLMPCSAWPKNPREYAEAEMAREGMRSFFSGVVTLPDGSQVQIAVPIAEELATKIACLGVEYALIRDKSHAAEREGVNRMMGENAGATKQRPSHSEMMHELQRQAQAAAAAEIHDAAAVSSPQYKVPSAKFPAGAKNPEWLEKYLRSRTNG